jgi:serine/threonine protein kinase
MHDQGIHHEDIKPSNIVHRGRTVFFTDFSSSRRLEEGHDTSTASPALASKLFAALEAICDDLRNPQRHGSKTDVFALGLVFLEMYTILRDFTLESLHQFLFGPQTAFKQYHRVINKLGDTQNSLLPLNTKPLAECIHTMLRLERKARPSAFSVKLELQTSHLGFRLDCSCMRASD